MTVKFLINKLLYQKIRKKMGYFRFYYQQLSVCSLHYYQKEEVLEIKIIFFELKSKYPDLFKRKFYPLSNLFINDLLKDNKNFSGCFSKDKIILLDNNKSFIYNLQNSNEHGSHWCSNIRKDNKIYVFDSFGIGEIPSEIYKIYKNFKIITNIYQIQHLLSILCGFYSIIYDILSFM